MKSNCIKKFIALVLAMIWVLVLVGCNQNKTISLEFPFEIEDVTNIEMYRFEGTPGYVEKKIVVAKDDIKTIYDMFGQLSFTIQNAKETAGATTTSFRFNLENGTNYELTYIGYGVKNGTLKSSTNDFEYFVIADIGSTWNNINVEVVQVEASELP